MKVNSEHGMGILRPHRGIGRAFSLSRIAPSAALQDVIEHYWTVAWDLRGEEPFDQETLSNPAAHLVIEPSMSEFVGPMRKKFRRTLSGQGRVFAAKFRVGGVSCFLENDLQEYQDLRLSPGALCDMGFAMDFERLEKDLLGVDETDLANFAHAFDHALLKCRKRELNSAALETQQIVLQLLADAETQSLQEVAKQYNLSLRQMQRRFRRYVGQSPKALKARNRLQLAANALDQGLEAPASLAADLGYADQSHLTRDFTSNVGHAPVAYSRASAKDRTQSDD